MSDAQPLSIDDLLLEQNASLLKAKKEREKNKQKIKENPPYHVRGIVEQREVEHGGMCIHIGPWPTHLLLVLPHLHISGWFLGWRILLSL